MPKEINWDGIDEVKLYSLINSKDWLLKGWHRDIAKKASHTIETLNDNLTEAYTLLEKEEHKSSILINKVSNLQESLKSKNNDLALQEEDNYRLEQTNLKLNQTLSEFKAKELRHSEIVELMRKGEAALHNRIEEDRVTLSDRQTKIIEQKRENDILEAANQQLNKAIDNYDLTVSKMEQDNEKLLEMHKEAKARISELESKLTSLKNQILFVLEGENHAGS